VGTDTFNRTAQSRNDSALRSLAVDKWSPNWTSAAWTAEGKVAMAWDDLGIKS